MDLVWPLKRVNPEAFRTHAFCEIDKHAQQVLRKHWPLTPIFEDITKLNGNIFRNRIDIICGGSPCQDVSIAGKQKDWWMKTEKLQDQAFGYTTKELLKKLGQNMSSSKMLQICEIKDLQHSSRILARSGMTANGKLFQRETLVPHTYAREFGSSLTLPTPTTFDSAHLATQEEKSEWWTKTASKFGTWWETEPEICRVANGLSGQMERNRREQIKRLGNAIVPSIVEIIAQRILEIENGYK